MSADAESLHPLIRPLNWGDLDRIMEIELAAYPAPWTRGIFSDCIRVGYDCWGLQLGRQLIGYSIQTGAAGEAHLLNLCVERQYRRRGFGALLLDNAIRVARASCDSMFLEVRPSNSAAIGLYQTRGFVIAGKRFGYYSAGGNATSGPNVQSASRLVAAREDALVMRLQLSDSQSLD